MRALVLLLLAAACVRAAPVTTVVLVRHAEKGTEPKADPPLTEAGAARAAVLPDALDGLMPDAVLSTNFDRTRSTAEPVARRFGLEVQLVDIGATDVAATLKERYRGKTVLVVGHSNTVPPIVAALGAAQPLPICEGEYDRLFIVRLPADGAATVEERRYGAPTSDDRCRAKE